MKFIFLLLLCLTFSGFSFGQEIKLPELQRAQIFQYLRNSISIHLFYNENSQLAFKVGNEISTEVDSLKSMLLKPLASFSNSTLDNGFVKVELLADETIKMFDVEILFQELRRLDLRKVLFAARLKNKLKVNPTTRMGFMHFIPQFNKKEIEAFYEKRNLPMKKLERISTTIIKKRKEEAEKLRTTPLQPGAPFPEPRIESMTPTEISLKRNYPKAKIFNMEIGTKKKIIVNGKKIKINDLNDFVLKDFLEGKCFFFLN